LAPDCAPLLLTDGFRESMTALLTHFGHWLQPERRQAHGPTPKPRWMPLQQLRYAQVVKTVRRRRLVRVSKAASSPCLRPGSTLALRGRGFHPALDQGDAHAPLEPQHKVPRPNGRGLNG
jgi:hypothetical protein